MQKNEKKYLKISALLYLILVILIYFGSFIKYLLNQTWYGSASAIAVIFIWVTVFLIATISASKAIVLVKERLKGKDRLDFTARLGLVIADFIKDGSGHDFFSLFKEVCEQNGVMKPPDLKKYFTGNKLVGEREVVYESIRKEIEEAADAWSKEKKK